MNLASNAALATFKAGQNNRSGTAQRDGSSANIAARLDRLPGSRTIWIMVCLIALGGWFEFYDVFFIGYVAPGMIKSGLFKPGSLGILSHLSVLSFSGFGTFVFATFAGLWVGTLMVSQLLDRFGRRAVFTWALLWYLGCNAVMAFQHTGLALDIWRFLGGIGIGIEFTTIDTYLAELVPSHVRGRAFAVQQMVSFCAVPFVALLAWRLVPLSPFGFDGWRWVVLIGTAGAVVVWFMRLGLPESPRWLAKHGRFAEADEIVSDLERRVMADTGRPLPPPSAELRDESGKGGYGEMFRQPYLRRIIMLSLFNFAGAFSYYGFAAWVPSLLAHRGITVTHSLEYAFIIAIANPLGPLFGSAFAERFERKWILCTGLAAMMACMFLFAQLSSGAALIACGVLFTLAANIQAFASHSYQSEIFPTRFRMRAVGFVWSWLRLSSAFSGVIVGYLLNTGGVLSVAVLIGVTTLLQILLIGVLGPRSTGLALEQISH
jgi:putative MFS transporter